VIFKSIVVILLLIVIFSLGSALYHLVNHKDNSDKLLKSLTWRIGLSVFIFVLLLLGWAMGLVQPHGL
jgi:O-antigen/teichoic acid export membrane protein